MLTHAIVTIGHVPDLLCPALAIETLTVCAHPEAVVTVYLTPVTTTMHYSNDLVKVRVGPIEQP
jgi:hypothetical protein